MVCHFIMYTVYIYCVLFLVAHFPSSSETNEVTPSTPNQSSWEGSFS